MNFIQKRTEYFSFQFSGHLYFEEFFYHVEIYKGCHAKSRKGSAKVRKVFSACFLVFFWKFVFSWWNFVSSSWSFV
jgi:hypothetical protein